MKLRDHIKQEQFSSPGHEAMLNVVVTSAWFLGEMAATMSPAGLTPAQYNVLRILRGSAPQMLTCSEIGARLLDRTPDVTRLLDRLERQGLVKRARSEQDRRVVHVGITEDGLAILEQIDPAVESAQEALTSSLTPDELRLLSELLDRLRSE